MRWLPSEPQGRRALYVLLGFVFLLFVLKMSLAIADPVFPDDAGHRMNNAYRPLARVGNRIWLPYLQTHIWILYLLHAPAWAFRLIPGFYILAGSGLLALLAWRTIGRMRGGIWFTLVLLFSCAHYPFSQRASGLYQELIGTAFLYLLLLGGVLALKPRPWLLLAGAASLLVRETFWIYLLVLSLLYWRRIRSEAKTRWIFLAMWAIPIGWLLAMPILLYVVDGHWPSFPIAWPLMVNKESGRTFMTSASLLSQVNGFYRSRLYFGAISILIVWLMGRRAPIEPPEELALFPRFSLLSLSIVVVLVATFNPWEFTPNNPRQFAAIAQHLPVWMILMFAASRRYPAGSRAAATVALAAGLLLTASPRLSYWLPRDHSDARHAHGLVRQTLAGVPAGQTPTVCFYKVEYFRANAAFIGASLYSQREYVQGEKDLARCHVIVGPPEPELDLPAGFVRAEVTVRGDPYSLYSFTR